jgi:hypothetical protein
MQRYITLENRQVCELPAGEFTVHSISEQAVVLIGQSCSVPPLELERGKTVCLPDFDLTYMERFDEGVHIKVESEKPFRASEMTIGGYDGNQRMQACMVVVVTHI